MEPLAEIFSRRRRETDDLERRSGHLIPWVFHRNGKPVKSIDGCFNNARNAAGLPAHTIHDFRRTAVKALHDLGYDTKTIMDMCGFKTEAMVHRYIGVTSDDRMLQAGAALRERRKNLATPPDDDEPPFEFL
jgi:integrase